MTTPQATQVSQTSKKLWRSLKHRRVPTDHLELRQIVIEII
jgi:hypothetical protein